MSSSNQEENNTALTNNPIVNNDDNIEFPNDELVDDANRVDELPNEEVLISLSTNRGDDFGDFEAPPKETLCSNSIIDKDKSNDDVVNSNELQSVVSDIANLDIIDESSTDYCESIAINNHPAAAVDVEIDISVTMST